MDRTLYGQYTGFHGSCRLDIRTLEDLQEICCGSVDSSAEAALEDNPDLLNSFGEIVKALDYNQALMDLESEGVDAVAIDRVVAEYRMQRQKENLPF